jgi:glucose/arabinose dehydrogenase
MSLRATASGLVAALFAASAAAAGVHGSQYARSGLCGPYALADVKTPKGVCVGVVAGPDQGLKMPRTIIEVGPGEFIITDMGGWVGPVGRVLRLRVAQDGTASVSQIYGGLYQPHGLARGPDGKIYVGEKGRISRFDPNAPGAAMELVLGDLPKDGLHPLTNLIFQPDGSLVVNIGAPTDRCETKAKPRVPQTPCRLTEGDRARAALWRIVFDKPGGKPVKTEVLARGLRNSMALAIEPKSGALLQGENGIDLPGEDEPVEELNVIKPGAHYGWPFCSGKGTSLPGSGLKSADCARYAPAAVELPPHSAPLGMIVYSGAMFPELAGKAVIALHGYRQYGHRLIALDAAAAVAAGNPAPADLVWGWTRKRGVRPMGAPVGLAQSRDGAIWIVEDKNRTVLVLLRASGIAKAPQPTDSPPVKLSPAPPGWEAFARDVVTPKCAACHVEARKSNPVDIWAAMAEQGWVGDGPLKDSKLARALNGAGPEKPMPPPAGLKSDPKAKAAFERLLGATP